jgi:hypothetical protein
MQSRFLTFLLILIFSTTSAVSAETSYVLDESYGNVPVTFVPNVGQFDSTIVFAAEGNSLDTLNSQTGTVFSLVDSETVSVSKPQVSDYNLKLHLQFQNANTNPSLTFGNPVSWKNNYFIGNNPDNWHTDILNYLNVRLQNIYEGIDLLLESNGRNIETSLIIHPNADKSLIAFKGSSVISGVDEDGNLIGGTFAYGDYVRIIEKPPVCIQVIDGVEVAVDLKYRYIDAGEDSNGTVLFEFGEYNQENDIKISLELFYSPLQAVKYVNEVNGVEVDDEGCAYVAGSAVYLRSSFYLKTLFAMKINPDGDGLEYVTYYDSNTQVTIINDIDVDLNNSLYLVGSTNNTFPTTLGSYQSIIDSDVGYAYVMKLSPTGNKIVYSILLGGSANNIGTNAYEIDVNSSGDVYVTGTTTSRDFPTTPGAYSNEFGSNKSTFISKIKNDGSELVYSTFIPDAGISEIIADHNGNIYMTGSISSSVLGPANIFTNQKMEDVYLSSEILIAKLNASGSDMEFLTIISGEGDETGTDIDVDDNGNIYVSGRTQSEIFPTTENAYERISKNTSSSYYDAVVLKIDPYGENLLYSTYLSGENNDFSDNIIYYEGGKVIVSGETLSNDFPFTEANNVDGYIKIYFFVIDTFTGNLDFCNTYLEGLSYGTAINKNGDIINVGNTSHNIPLDNSLFDTNSISNDAVGYIIKLLIDETTEINEYSEITTFAQVSAYPNPFNPSVTLSYQLFSDSDVTLDIYNIHGQKISTVVNELQQKGLHNVQWNGSKFPSGVYFYRIQAGNEIKNGKLMLLK